jgi:aspartate-semialdehyde dehydrogenase
LRIGLLHPTTLLGQELRERLATTLGSHVEWILLGIGDEVGTVTEVGRSPALVEDAAGVDVVGLDLLVTCGASAEELETLRPAVGGPIVLQVAAESVCTGGEPLVWGVNSARAGARSLIAANAITIMLAHALATLENLEAVRITSTVLLPVSVRGRSALDEVLEQARALLAFQEVPPATVLGAQLAFNLLPPAGATRLAPEPASLVSELAAVRGHELEASFGLLYAGVFHGLGILARIELARPVDPAEIRRRLLGSSRIAEPSHADAGPIDTAAREEVLIGAVLPAERPEAVWLWLLADNLALTAANAAAIVESLALDTRPDQAN